LVEVFYPLKFVAWVEHWFNWFFPTGDFPILEWTFYPRVMESHKGPETEKEAPSEKHRYLATHT
jgi:hypothetical protein